METLKELALKNAEKSSYVRKGMMDFMEAWKDITNDCEAVWSGPVYVQDTQYMTMEFCLVTGRRELKDNKHDSDIHENKHFSNALTISELRGVSAKLPKAIEQIIHKLNTIDAENDKTIQALSALIGK